MSLYHVYTKTELVAQVETKDKAVKIAKKAASVSRNRVAFVYKDGLLEYSVDNTEK